MSLIRGTAMWASVQAPNTTYDPVYCIDLLIDEEDADRLKAEGLKPKKTDDGSWMFKFKRNVNRANGETNSKPKIVDAANAPLTSLVGNGSLVEVQYGVYDWNNKFGSGTGSDLQGVMVLELVSYKPGDGDEFVAHPEYAGKENKVDEGDLPFDEEL